MMTAQQPTQLPDIIKGRIFRAIDPSVYIEDAVQLASRTMHHATSTVRVTFSKDALDEINFCAKELRIKGSIVRTEIHEFLAQAFQLDPRVSVALIALNPAFGTLKGYTATVVYDTTIQ